MSARPSPRQLAAAVLRLAAGPGSELVALCKALAAGEAWRARQRARFDAFERAARAWTAVAADAARESVKLRDRVHLTWEEAEDVWWAESDVFEALDRARDLLEDKRRDMRRTYEWILKQGERMSGIAARFAAALDFAEEAAKRVLSRQSGQSDPKEESTAETFRNEEEQCF